MREYQDRAAAKGTKQTKTDQEEGHKHEPDESKVRTEENAPQVRVAAATWHQRRVRAAVAV